MLVFRYGLLTIGSYHGRLLETATSLNYRLDQIYSVRAKRWLDVHGDYTKSWPRHYFFTSTICRFMAFVATANRFEREAIYFDSRIATDTDRLVLFLHQSAPLDANRHEAVRWSGLFG
jgi:hypothetical protein